MYLMRTYPDEIDVQVPRLYHLPRYVVQAQRRVPRPPAFLYDDPVGIDTRKQVEDLVRYIHTCVSLAAQTAFDGLPVRSESGRPVTCDDILSDLVYWIRLVLGFFDGNFDDVECELWRVQQLITRARDDETFDHGGASMRFSILNQLRHSLERDM